MVASYVRLVASICMDGYTFERAGPLEADSVPIPYEAHVSQSGPAPKYRPLAPTGSAVADGHSEARP